MAIARKTETRCPACGDASDVWRFEKGEGSIVKECYTCKRCGAEWSEVARVKD